LPGVEAALDRKVGLAHMHSYSVVEELGYVVGVDWAPGLNWVGAYAAYFWSWDEIFLEAGEKGGVGERACRWA